MNSRVSRFVCWVLLAAAFAWSVLAVFDLGGQRRLFHVEGKEFMSDYSTPRACAAAADPYHPGVVKDVDACYPALAYAIVRAFPESISGGVVLTLLMTVIYLCSLTAVTRRSRHSESALKPWAVALPVVVCVVSAPMLFTIERGNLVILAAAGIAFFVAFYDSPRKALRIFAAFALAVAVALKIAPVVFGMLYLLPSRTDEDRTSCPSSVDICSLLRFAVFSAVLFFVPFLFFGGIPDGPVSWFGNAQQNSSEYALATRWGFVALGRAIHHALGHDVHSVWRGYAACRAASIALGVGCLLAAGKMRRNRSASSIVASNAAFLVASALLLLPPQMHFYTGLYLLPAFALRAGDWGCSKLDIFEAVLWLVMLVPVQIPFGSSSLNTPIVALAHIALVGVVSVRSCFDRVR